MAIVTIHEAKTQLSKLIARAEAGEEIVIARGKDPVVRLTPVAKPKPNRVPGRLKGKVHLFLRSPARGRTAPVGRGGG